ncbi:hypothetical protein IWQ62_006085 [Dispira parvispora]|uniref:Uncharacterized protein n=1 Tax=Dispira parvispora TaxID=1520584 RepID=A0A9W8AL04_9FUNG|nr:hypothetical protein IWQ62_006085 [Dispira parvispora]
MPKDNVHDKAEADIPSEQKHPKQNRRDNRRQANRDRSGGVRKRKHNSSTCTSSGSSPSGVYFHPITSATEFTKEHMDALHMVPVLNCPIEEVVPISHCPEDLLHRIRPFWSASREDLYNRDFERLVPAAKEAANGPNHTSYSCLSMSTILCLHAVMHLIDMFSGVDSDMSDPDGEVKSVSKITTTGCADSLCNQFLEGLAQLCSQTFPTWDYRPMTWDVKVLPERYNFTVRPDRVIFYAQSKRQKTPFAWVTINPDYLAPTTDEYESTLPQVAAQTIAMARYHPREAFGIQFSFRYVTFWRAVIPENYLELIKGSGDLPPDVFIEMKRSTVLDLEQPDGRYGFSRALLSLLMYWNEQV